MIISNSLTHKTRKGEQERDKVDVIYTLPTTASQPGQSCGVLDNPRLVPPPPPPLSPLSHTHNSNAR